MVLLWRKHLLHHGVRQKVASQIGRSQNDPFWHPILPKTTQDRPQRRRDSAPNLRWHSSDVAKRPDHQRRGPGVWALYGHSVSVSPSSVRNPWVPRTAPQEAPEGSGWCSLGGAGWDRETGVLLLRHKCGHIALVFPAVGRSGRRPVKESGRRNPALTVIWGRACVFGVPNRCFSGSVLGPISGVHFGVGRFGVGTLKTIDGRTTEAPVCCHGVS